MKLQDIVGRQWNVPVILMNQGKNIPIAQNFFFSPVPGGSPVIHQLLQSRMGGNNAFDTIGAFRTLDFCDFNETLEFYRFLTQEKLLPAFVFMDLGHIRQNFIIPCTIFQQSIIKFPHNLSPFSQTGFSFSQFYMIFGRKTIRLGKTIP